MVDGFLGPAGLPICNFDAAKSFPITPPPPVVLRERALPSHQTSALSKLVLYLGKECSFALYGIQSNTVAHEQLARCYPS